MIAVIFAFNPAEGISQQKFEDWYETRHVPDLVAVPEVREYLIGRTAALTEGAAYRCVAEFRFDSEEDMKRAMQSERWHAATADAAAWIGDSQLLICDARIADLKLVQS